MSYRRVLSRKQHSLFPRAPPKTLLPSEQAREIDAFVETLEPTEFGFERPIPAHTGRPPYDPKNLLKLLLYGALRGIRSCRKLERAAALDPHLSWLLRGEKPKYKTIANFKKKNSKTLQTALRQFVAETQSSSSETLRQTMSPKPNGPGDGQHPPPGPSHARRRVHASPEAS